MNEKETLLLLKQSILSMTNIPDVLIEELYNICSHHRYKKGEYFIQAGNIPKRMGFNLNGIFRYFYIDEKGNEFTKGFSIPGKFVTSHSALVQGRGSYFFIQALEDTDTLLFDFQTWMTMMRHDIRWFEFAYRLTESVMIMKEMREKAFLLDDAATRYIEFRYLYGDLEKRIRQYHVASFLGITPESLSRIRKKLKLT